jgi:hypothetical protein
MQKATPPKKIRILVETKEFWKSSSAWDSGLYFLIIIFSVLKISK